MTRSQDGERPPGDTTLFEAGPGLHDGPAPALDDDGFETRYEPRSLLGEGGMGEVRLCNDARIGREVAMKLVHPERQESERVKASFLQEARIQGRLEHPSVVPVHELGTAPGGGLYFTMRRVHGESLDVVLGRQRDGDLVTQARWTRRRLLAAFCSICSAIDFAHQRGVIHRDLKPSNVMLGEFGEAYIIDWGCAVYREASDERVPRGSTPSDLAGTPGFMAPELLHEVGSEADRRADIYALGAILFEMLTLEPLHPRGDRRETIESTRRGADARASVRAPDREIAPELDAICVRATALDPSSRYATAGELVTAVEAYLDGDRDVELRRRTAEDEARAAAEAASPALAGSDHAGEARHEAMQAVARALALDPDNALARQTMVRLLMEPPKELPPEARRQLEEQQSRQGLLAVRWGAFAYLGALLLFPLLVWMGPRNPSFTLGAFAVMGALVAAGGVVMRLRRDRATRALVMLTLVTIGTAMLSRIAGAFVLVPTLAAVNTVVFALVVVRTMRAPALAAGLVAILLPAALDWAGLTQPSYAFEDGALTILPVGVGLEPVPTQIFLVLANLVIVLAGWMVVTKLRDAFEESEKRVLLHAWHLNMLVSDRASRPGQKGGRSG